MLKAKNNRRNSYTQVVSSLPQMKRPRWEQIAANTAVPVTTFKGIQDLPKAQALLYKRQAAPVQKKAISRSSSGAVCKSTDLLNDGECLQAREKVDKPNGLDEYDVKFLQKLSEHLRVYAQDCAFKGDYHEARAAAAKRQIVLDVIKGRKPKPPEDNAIDEQERIIRENREKWDEEIREFDEQTQDKVSQMYEEFEKELQDLDDEWANNMMEKYRKPSALLIKQRVLETDMIKRDQYEQAAFIHESVRLLEEKEEALAQANFEKDYNEAKQGLIDFQNHSYETYYSMRMNQRDLLLKKIDRKEVTLYNRLNVLHQKPPPLTSFKATLTKPAEARPVAIFSEDEAHNPGRKLPALTLPSERPNSRTSRRAQTSQGMRPDSQNQKQHAQTQRIQSKPL